MIAEDKRKTEVLLVNPPYHMKPAGALAPPLGLAYIAAFLKKKGISVDIVDCTPLRIFSDKEIEVLIKGKDPLIVGISSTTPMITKALHLAAIVKKIKPSIMTILGGPHITALPIQMLKSSENVDIVVLGEGETAMAELVQCLRSGKDLSTISGIAYRKNGKVYQTVPRSNIEDLDSLPFPAHELLPKNRYHPSIKWYNRIPFTTMITSRGCPFNCIFCDSHLTFGRKTRFRSAENVIAEIEYLIINYGIKEIAFYDDTFTLDKSRVHNICDLILSKKLDITWGCLSRVDTVDKHLLTKMAKAGCHIISFGIESGSEKMLKIMQKSITLQDSIKAIRLAKELKIDTAATLILGIPGETRETLRETALFIKKIDPTYALFFRVVPFPGTKLYDMYLQQNKDKVFRWEEFIEGQNQPLLALDTISSKELEEMSKKIYRQFYLRPSKTMQYCKRMTSIYKIKGYLRALRTFLQMT